MEDQRQSGTAPLNAGEIEHQVVKGMGLLLLCLERGRSLGMKGFIDSQIERGARYIPVVERVASHIDLQLERADTREKRALLRDLHDYADAQLRAVQSACNSPGHKP